MTVRDALGNTTQMAYDALGNTTVITDANGHGLTIEYDALSRPAIIRNALGQTISYTYNAAGNVTRITDAAGEYVTIDYDVLNRPITVTDKLGHDTTFAYDVLGQVIEETDGNGIVTRYNYDELSRLVEVIANYQPGQSSGVNTNISTRYGYDRVGNLTSLTDPRNYVTQFSYDPMGRMLSMTDPLSRTMAYEYDPRGLISQWTKADGTAISYDYNPLGQLTQLTAPDQLVQYFYDAAGRRSGMVDAEGTTGYELDALGRPLTITLATGEAVSYRYDGVGNRTHTIYPDGKTVVYAYNDLNQVTSINDWDEGVTTYEYDENGRPITITLPNETVSTLTYDAAGNVTSIVHTSDAGQVIGSYSYSYDATGRRLGAVENGTTISYTYDALYRLTDADHSNGNLYHYEYDAAGNRLIKQEPGETVVYTYDSANQLTHVGGAPTTLDANGNLLNDGNRSYAYDDLDRLIQVTQGITSTQYGYTGDGDRLWQKTDGVTTTFTLDLNGALAQVLAQSQGSALTTVNFLPGIGQQQSGGYWTYFHADALGSVRDLSGVTGNAIGHVDYSPFGEIVNSTGMASWFGFTGEQQDGSSGLAYLRARYYDPALGRFLTPDSLIPDITNGQALNAYAYVYNDPINFVDLSGNSGSIPFPFVPTLTVPNEIIEYGAKKGLAFLDWWNSVPNQDQCSCQGTSSNLVGALAIGPQAAWAYASEPAARYGTKIVENVVAKQVPGFWRKLPIIRNLPGNWGYKTVQVWEKSRPISGYLDELVSPGMPRGNGLHYTGSTSRYTLQTRPIPKWGWKGIGGTIALAGIIDGVFQFASDSADPCFTWGKRFSRAALATTLGLVAGAAGALAFGIAVAFTAPAWVAIGLSFAVGAGVGYVLSTQKDKIFANNPQYFGH